MKVLRVFKEIEKNELNHFKYEFERHKKNIDTNVAAGPLMKLLAEEYTPYIIRKLEPVIGKSISYNW